MKREREKERERERERERKVCFVKEGEHLKEPHMKFITRERPT